MNVIECKGICKEFAVGGQTIAVLHNANLAVSEGEFVAIVGSSGSGKSTLLNLIGMLDSPTSGSIVFGENEVRSLGERERALLRNQMIGYVFQSFYLEPDYTVIENVEMPLVIAGVPKKERRKRAEELLQRVGLSNLIGQKAKLLSGGEKQRTCIARALVNNPKIILADEPTGNLDSLNSAEIIDLFRSIAENGCAVLMVTHSTEDAAKADRIIRMKDGCLSDEAKE